MERFEIKGNIADVVAGNIFYGIVTVKDGKIESLENLGTEKLSENYILPGFVDSHVHIESSMLIPTEFARLAVRHGTVATVSDPHEIANVCGIAGVRFMLDNAEKSPFYFNFGAPSCVPATNFETAGATLGPEEVDELLSDSRIKYLSEMMNYPGVLFEDTIVMKKIAIAKEHGKPIDGHAPGLKGEDARKYAAAGISTDHECYMLDEALDKIAFGMKILIREGSAAKNFDTLASLIDRYPELCMLCSDDKHPDSLLLGHLNQILERGVAKGLNVMNLLRAATINPVKHYGLENGLLQPGDNADFIIAKDLVHFNIEKTYIKGQLVAENGNSLLESVEAEPINNFNCSHVTPQQFKIKAETNTVNAIVAVDGSLITENEHCKIINNNGYAEADVENDILKFAVVNRYFDTEPAVAFIKNIGIKKGAVASNVGHDSHNIIVAGTNDEDIAAAVNAIIDSKGGLSVAVGDYVFSLPLPVGGILSNEKAETVADKYMKIDKIVKEWGSPLAAPFMTLSFMALLVIPTLKLSDKGLFDGKNFKFTNLFV